MSSSYAPKEADTIIGKNTNFTGVFKTVGVLHVEGNFVGSQLIAEQVYILPKGTVTASIEAESIFIEGNVTGNIRARSRVFLLPGAYIKGDIITAELITQKGSILDGHCKIQH